MFKHIDWLMICDYFKAYAICLTSLLSLYIVVDLFTHLDDFLPSQGSIGLQATLIRIVSYYGYRLPQFFDRLCEAITLLAAMFTVAMMQRNNEQLPLLSAGVSTHRLVTPVLICACLMLSLAVLNQEVFIPMVASKLTLNKDDPGGEKEISVRGNYEPNFIHIEGDFAVRATQTVRNFRCTIPESVAGNLIHISAQQGRYLPPDEEQPRGRWELTGCVPRDLEPIPDLLEVRDAGRYLLYTRLTDFEALVRQPSWFQFASTQRLYEELLRPESTRLAAIAVLFHNRLTRPLLGMILVFMGLSVILRDNTRNVIISAGLCLVLCAVFYVAIHTCKMLGDYEYLAPAFAAWLPVLLFGPFALALFDAIQT
jgi:lipopolysaccharide export system permease protein